MCGSNDIVKEDEFYVCQNCGTKYSPDEAKKMYNNEVEINGKVQVDKSADVENLEILMDRNIQNNQWDEVAKYARDIVEKDPNNWKAIFFKELAEAWIVPYDDTKPLLEVIPATKTAIEILESSYSDDDEIQQDKNFMADHINSICYGAADTGLKNYNDNLSSVYSLWDVLKTNIEIEEFVASIVSDDKKPEIYSEIVRYASELEPKRGFNTPGGSDTIRQRVDTKDYAEKIKEEYTQKIHETDPDFEPEEIKGDGCYIATAVYGSYYCPEVYTLRCFRDKILYPNFFGRMFIRVYYATSPYLVKYFGDTKIFNKIFRRPLDIFVKKLQESNIESTYYIDNKYEK